MDREEEVFNQLKGKYKHYCWEFDEMAMDETWPEFEYCTCFEPHVYTETRHLRAEALKEIENSGSLRDVGEGT